MGQTGSAGEQLLPQEGEDGTMKAFVMEAPGRLADIKQVDVYLPKPEKGEIRVKVFAAGINPVDYKRCQATDSEFPCIVGSDVAGVVDEVGTGVTQWKPGDAVYYHCNVRRQYGAFAEYSLTNGSTVSPLPEGVTFAEAAAIPCAGWTAFIALYYKLKISQGQSILINGASGGVGSYAIQLAKLSGLKVFACTANHKYEYVKGLGADYTLSSEESIDDIADTILNFNDKQMVDCVLDCVSGKSAADSIRFLKLNGQICSVAGAIPGSNEFFLHGVSIHYISLEAIHNRPDGYPLIQSVGRDMGALFSRKQIRAPLEETKFEQIPAALETLQLHQVKGKLVATLVAEKDQQAEIDAIIAAAEELLQQQNELLQQQQQAGALTNNHPQQTVPVVQHSVVATPVAATAAIASPVVLPGTQQVSQNPALPATTGVALPSTAPAVYPATPTPQAATQALPSQKTAAKKGWLW